MKKGKGCLQKQSKAKQKDFCLYFPSTGDIQTLSGKYGPSACSCLFRRQTP